MVLPPLVCEADRFNPDSPTRECVLATNGESVLAGIASGSQSERASEGWRVRRGQGTGSERARCPPRGAVDGHPRVFSQTFTLAPDPNAPPTKSGEVAKYYIIADALRFVG